MTRSRCFDGQPETPGDTRFFDLRESGYSGPIDQDGYPTADPEVLEVFDSLAEGTARVPDSVQEIGWDRHP